MVPATTDRRLTACSRSPFARPFRPWGNGKRRRKGRSSAARAVIATGTPSANGADYNAMYSPGPPTPRLQPATPRAGTTDLKGNHTL